MDISPDELRAELRELAWLASLICGLSALAVGLAITLALAVDGLQHLPAVPS